MLKAKYDGGKMKRMKSVFTAQSDQDQIAGYTLKLEDSFRLFMASLVWFILHVIDFCPELCHEFHRTADATHA